MSKPKHILVIRFSAMGDVAMTVPVLRALTQQYPDLKITILTRAFFKPFFRDLPNVFFIPAQVSGRHKGFFGLWKLFKELRKLDIHAIADMHNVLRSHILKFFFFGKQCIQIDKGRTGKNELISGKKFQQLKTTHQRYADVFEHLGFKVDLTNPDFPQKSVLNNRVLALLGQDSKKWIGIAPFATYQGKMYPLGLMKTVIETLSKEYKLLLFGGGKHEMDILNNFEETFENVINLAGKLSLKEEMDVISNLDVMLSMDSGNAHIAAMLGVKVVTIWGVTHPFAGFAPFSQPENYALISDRSKFPGIPTSVYGNKYPENHKEASQSIAPQTVVNKIKSIL